MIAWRITVGTVAAAVLMAAAGCAHVSNGTRSTVEVAPCRQATPTSFVLTGPINAEMAACVAESFKPTTEELTLNSQGGDVAAALDIAAHFEGRRLSMRVEGQCSSSCANYFLPLAGRIVVDPDAVIIIHGSIDPWTAARIAGQRDAFVAEQLRSGSTADEANTRYDQGINNIEALVTRQAAFVARNRIAPGWLLYRHATDPSGRVEDLSNAPSGVRYLLVEEPMLRSCLQGIDIQPFQADLRRHWLASYRRLGLIWTRTRPSGAAVCR